MRFPLPEPPKGGLPKPSTPLFNFLSWTGLFLPEPGTVLFPVPEEILGKGKGKEPTPPEAFTFPPIPKTPPPLTLLGLGELLSLTIPPDSIPLGWVTDLNLSSLVAVVVEGVESEPVGLTPWNCGHSEGTVLPGPEKFLWETGVCDKGAKSNAADEADNY